MEDTRKSGFMPLLKALVRHEHKQHQLESNLFRLFAYRISTNILICKLAMDFKMQFKDNLFLYKVVEYKILLINNT